MERVTREEDIGERESSSKKPEEIHRSLSSKKPVSSEGKLYHFKHQAVFCSVLECSCAHYK